jgi:exodeoxyribonuclease-5
LRATLKAGTGKTTLVKFAVAALGLKEDEVGYAAPTGKAALVMQSMGNKDAMTIHRFLYDWYPRDNGKFYRRRKEWLPYKVAVIDEISMIDKEFIDELFRHHETYYILLGDPFQLPSINAEGNHLLENPHVFLTEIMRQAGDNDIPEMTLNIREGKGVPAVDGQNYKILTYDQVTNGAFGWADQVICATNATRWALNKEISAYHGFTPGVIENGQKVICIRNYWNIVSIGGQPLVNGTIGIVDNVREVEVPILPRFHAPVKSVTHIVADLCVDDDIFLNLHFDKQQLLTGTPSIVEGWLRGLLDKWYNGEFALAHGYVNPIALEADMGWAITCHKAQGSQYGKVLVYEERFPYPREEHARWLYTAATRPTDKLTLVRL